MIIVFSNFLFAIAKILDFLLDFILIILAISAISSWIVPYSNNQFIRFTNSFTNLFLDPIRKKIPSKGGVDWSFIIFIIIIIFVNYAVVQFLADFALKMKSGAMKL